MKGLKEKLSRMVSDIFNCHCIQAVPFNFVSRQFNNISVRLHVTKEKIRKYELHFWHLHRLQFQARNLSCQSQTRRITRRIRDACRDVATVKIERSRRTSWAKRMQIPEKK